MLKWDKVHEEKGDHNKFQKILLGPFFIAEKIGPRTFRLQTLEGQFETFPVNGLILKKIYFFIFSSPKFVYNFVYELVYCTVFILLFFNQFLSVNNFV